MPRTHVIILPPRREPQVDLVSIIYHEYRCTQHSQNRGHGSWADGDGYRPRLRSPSQGSGAIIRSLAGADDEGSGFCRQAAGEGREQGADSKHRR